MKKISLLLSIIVLILVACNSESSEYDIDQLISSENPALEELENTLQAEDRQTGSSDSQGDSPVRPTIEDQFQNIYIDPEQVKIIQSEVVEWPDSCLGIEQIGVDCVPGITQGYAVTLEAKGLEFAYHSNQVGSQVHPATAGLVWTRDDGGNALCDRLIFFLPDTAYACWCEEGQVHTQSVNLQEILTEEEYTLLINSLSTFSENTVNHASSDQPNPVMVSLTFHGQGRTFPNSNQQDSLLMMAELIFGRITELFPSS